MKRVQWLVVGLLAGVGACAEAKITSDENELLPVPDAPPAPDAPPTPDDATVPDAPLLDAPSDAGPDATPDAVADATPDSAPDAAPDAPPDSPPLPADSCDTAIDISAQAALAGGFAAQDTTDGFHNDSYPACGFSSFSGPDRAYRIDMTAGDILTVLATPTGGSGVDMAISLSRGCGAGEVCVNSADSGYTDDQEVMVWVVDVSASYYLYIDGYYDGTSGPYSLNVIVSTPPG